MSYRRAHDPPINSQMAQEVAAGTDRERQLLQVFVSTGTLTARQAPELSRAERRQLRKKLARWASAAGHRMDYRDSRSRFAKRRASERVAKRKAEEAGEALREKLAQRALRRRWSR